MTSPDSPNWPLFLGCPVWSCDKWAGQVYPPRTARKDWLAWYTRTFNTVEGNSTFYALPSLETTRRWADESAKGFRFCFKVPRLISHELQLVKADEELHQFLNCIQPLANSDRLGPTFLQLSPSFGPERLESLESFLTRLPKSIPWAVEVRHLGWFDQSDNENRLNDLLSKLSIDKVLFDSRPLYQAPADDEIERVSQTRKPKTPLRRTVTARRPFLRIVGRNNVAMAERFFQQWAPIVSNWIEEGLTPYIFTHAPDDSFAPELARRFAMHVQDETRSIQIPRPPLPPRQLSLLD